MMLDTIIGMLVIIVKMLITVEVVVIDILVNFHSHFVKYGVWILGCYI